MKLHGAVGGVLFCLVTAALGAAGCSSSSSSSGSCSSDSSLDCSGGGDGVDCTGGATPDSSYGDCSDPSPQSDGSDGYCCITTAITDCTEDDSVTGCADGSYGFSCSAGAPDPSTEDSSLICSTPTPDGSQDDYCCAPSGGGSSGGSSGSSSGSASGCEADSTLQCDAGATGVDCPSGDTPDASTFGICSDPSTQSDGSDGFCCVDQTFSDCTEDDSVTATCDYPSFGFSCTSGSPDPSADDPSLTCSTPTTDPTTGDDLYCCQ